MEIGNKSNAWHLAVDFIDSLQYHDEFGTFSYQSGDEHEHWLSNAKEIDKIVVDILSSKKKVLSESLSLEATQ